MRLSLLLSCLVTLATQTQAWPLLHRRAPPSLQDRIQPGAISGPRLSPAPYDSMIGLSLGTVVRRAGKTVLEEVEIFVRAGERVTVEENADLPLAPRTIEITSVPRDGTKQRHQCVVYPAFDVDGDKEGVFTTRPRPIIVNDMAGLVDLYDVGSAEGLDPGTEVAGYSCF